MTKKQKEQLLDLAAFIEDAVKSKEKHLSWGNVTFAIAHDLRGWSDGGKFFLARTHDWRARRVKGQI